jgi:tetratricopeptide (TPR) repeat protein
MRPWCWVTAVQGMSGRMPRVSDFWTNRALDYIRSQPAGWLKLMVRKAALTFNTIEITDTESQNVYAEASWLLRIPLDFGLLFGMAALGAVLTAASWRRVWFLYAILATYALSVALFYVFARYRFPIVLILMLLAAGGLLQAFDLVRLRRFRALAAAAAAAGLAIAISHLPLDDPHRYRATHYLSVAIALSTDPAQADVAMEFYRRALDAAPQLPSAEIGLGAILSRLGRQEEAIPYFRKALASWPDYPEAHYDLGVALAAAGQPQEAAQEYTEVLRLSPDDAAAHIAFGKTLTVLNHLDLAVGHLQQGLAVRPKDVNGLVGLGAALTRLGRTEEAIQDFQRALQIDPQDAAAHNDLGWTLASRGHVAEAVPHFEKALALDPNYANARENLAQARTILSRMRGK